MLPDSTKPYLLRALYQWCVDQEYTPHVVVRVDTHCRVPMQYVRDGEITLNVSPNATKDFFIDDEWISFTARFNGVSQLLSFPITAVSAIYSRDTQEGMGFAVSDYDGGKGKAKSTNLKTDENTTKKENPFKLVD